MNKDLDDHNSTLAELVLLADADSRHQTIDNTEAERLLSIIRESTKKHRTGANVQRNTHGSFRSRGSSRRQHGQKGSGINRVPSERSHLRNVANSDSFNLPTIPSVPTHAKGPSFKKTVTKSPQHSLAERVKNRNLRAELTHEIPHDDSLAHTQPLAPDFPILQSEKTEDRITDNRRYSTISDFNGSYDVTSVSQAVDLPAHLGFADLSAIPTRSPDRTLCESLEPCDICGHETFPIV